MKLFPQCEGRRSFTGFLFLAGILISLLILLQPSAHAAYTSTFDSYGEKIVYGYSGEGRELVAYKYGSGNNVMVLGFEIHGYEDHFAKDGACLVYTAYQVIDYLKSSQLVDDHGWTVYVLPKMNPDGLESGTTNNGPGRCTTTCLDSSGNISTAHGIDMNRCFPTDFTPRYTLRNYTGTTALGCREAVALYNFVKSVQGSGSNILFDVHGWEQSTIVMDGKYGLINSTVSKYFTNNTWKTGYSNAGGYLTTWAHGIGYTTCLLEMPASYYSYSSYVNSSCSQNMIYVVRDLLQTTALVHHHSYQQTSVQDATCTAEGLRTSVCSCGDTITETIPAKGHQWELTDVTEEPTATGDGSGNYLCSVCGAEKHDIVSRIFTDTTHSAYYAESVDWCYDEGIIRGLGAHTFGPGVPLTRGMLVTLLYRFSGSPETEYRTIFDDVPDGKYYTDAVIWAYENGIVLGTSATTYNPQDNITRQQLATMLYRYVSHYELDNGERSDFSGYTDTDEISDYAQTAMEWCVANGIIKGTTTTLLSPKGNANRAQSAAMLYRLKNYIENQQAADSEKDPDEDTEEDPQDETTPEGEQVPADGQEPEVQEPSEPGNTATDETEVPADETEDNVAKPEENAAEAETVSGSDQVPALESSAAADSLNLA